MFNLKNLFTRALLALMLVSSAGVASAGPIYHVTIDTTGRSGSGVFDFLFSGDAVTAGAATATLSNVSGDFGAGEAYGDASGSLASNLVFGNSGGYAELLQVANLGGVFGFDLRFDLAPAGDGTTFGIALYNEALDAYLGIEGKLAQFELVPGDVIGVSDDNALTRNGIVSEVPEPAAVALLALGLALMAWPHARAACIEPDRAVKAEAEAKAGSKKCTPGCKPGVHFFSLWCIAACDHSAALRGSSFLAQSRARLTREAARV